MQIMKVVDDTAALKAFYGNGYIGNAEIKQIFGIKSSSTISRLKKMVPPDASKVVPYHVSVDAAFKAWGVDIEKLEHNRKKRKQLGL